MVNVPKACGKPPLSPPGFAAQGYASVESTPVLRTIQRRVHPAAWPLVNIQARTPHNQATSALANKLARICFSVLRDVSAYGDPQPRVVSQFEIVAP